MATELFIVKVDTSDHDADLMDHFAKHLAYKFAGSAYHIIDVQKAVIETEEKSCTSNHENVH
jgi:hypothetical protein